MNLYALAVVCSLLFAQSPVEQPSLTSPREKIRVLNITSQGEGHRIKANPSHSWGHGYFVGRPLGIFIEADPTVETYLLGIYIEGSTENAGRAVARIQAANVEVYRKFLTLLRNESYVFEYDHNLPVPFLDTVSRTVVAIYTTHEFLDQRKVESVPRMFVSGSKFIGSLGSGTQHGRVIDVQRTGWIGPSCTFGVETGKTDSSGRSSIYFNILDEQLCSHVENILALRRRVEVRYARDLIEAWEPSQHFAQAIRILETSDIDQF